MEIIRIKSFLIKKKTMLITLTILIVIAWSLGQFIVPTVMKVIFL